VASRLAADQPPTSDNRDHRENKEKTYLGLTPIWPVSPCNSTADMSRRRRPPPPLPGRRLGRRPGRRPSSCRCSRRVSYHLLCWWCGSLHQPNSGKIILFQSHRFQCFSEAWFESKCEQNWNLANMLWWPELGEHHLLTSSFRAKLVTFLGKVPRLNSSIPVFKEDWFLPAHWKIWISNVLYGSAQALVRCWTHPCKRKSDLICTALIVFSFLLKWKIHTYIFTCYVFTKSFHEK
jgi:hypothetical protein